MEENNYPSFLVNSLGNLKISIAIAYNDLTFGEKLGSGGFGDVYKGQYKYNDVAIKVLKDAPLSESVIQEFKREASLMAKLSSPCIIRLYGACFEPTHYALVMEYMPKGSLFNVLQSTQVLDWKVRYQMGFDASVGLAHLHGENIIHADLKSLNVLVDSSYRCKLADFGLSKVKLATSATQSYFGQQREERRVGWPPNYFLMPTQKPLKQPMFIVME
jgi:serine/threonine protein kinase